MDADKVERSEEMKKEPVVVSKTGEGELLIYKSDGKNGFINIVIDKDGDIELIHVTDDRDQTTNKANATVDEAITFWNKFVSKDSHSEIESLKCQTGCKYFSGGEVHHHPDCVHYPESMSMVYDEMKAKIKELESKLADEQKRHHETLDQWNNDAEYWKKELIKFRELSPKEEEQEELFYELCKMVHSNESVDKLKSQFTIIKNS